MDRNAPIGVFDSGIGGLTVARDHASDAAGAHRILWRYGAFHMEVNRRRRYCAIPARSSVF